MVNGLVETARAYAKQAASENTLKTYAAAFHPKVSRIDG